jgi:NSS family neurotransmitter:Na+ symporter
MVENTKFTRIGFIVATVGSAVGLGNIWKFPYITGEYGGGAFVAVYLLTIIFIGISVLIAEMFLGKFGGGDTVSTFEKVGNDLKKPIPSLKYVGFMGFNGLIIMAFYSVVIGWIFYYIWSSINGLPSSVEEAKIEFDLLTDKNIGIQILFHTVATLTVLHFVNGGIKEGIEKLNNILIPSLILILFALLIYSSTFDAFSQSLSFLFYPDWDKLNAEAFIRAVGHSFFTLSLGMGAIMTYSASFPKGVGVAKSAITVGFFDTLIALVAGIIIFTLLFQFGEQPEQGPGLVFISMPVVFHHIGDIGSILSILFLLALAMAGLTSAVSLVEPAVLYAVDRLNVSRFKSTIVMGLAYYIFGIFAILSYSKEYGEIFSFGGKPLFDILSEASDMILLPIFGIVIAITIGYGFGKKLEPLREEMGDVLFQIWLFSIRVLAPIAIVFLMLTLFGVVQF